MNLKEELVEYLDSHNSELIETPETLLTKSKIKIRCNDCGTEYEISAIQLLHPHPERTYPTACPMCTSKYKFIAKIEKTYGRNPYELLSEFKGYDQPIKVRCKDCGYEWETKKAKNILSTANLPEGAHVCAGCTKIRAKENAGKDIKELQDKLIEKFGACEYTFPHPEEYTGMYSKKPIHVVCTRCGYEMFTVPSNLMAPSNGEHYCKGCNKSGSNTKKKAPSVKQPTKKSVSTVTTTAKPTAAKSTQALTDITLFIKSIYSKTIISNDTTTLSAGRMDIYLPDIKVAFNVDALLSESEDKVGKRTHLKITEDADAHNIELHHIFDDEWYQKEEVVKRKIESILKVNKPGQIYARVCQVGDCTASEKNAFFDANHIQGCDKAKIYKCLRYNGEIVAIMSFTTPRLCMGNHTIKAGQYELSRFATSKHVLGAFSKLFKAIIKAHPEITEVTTFADRRWSMKKSNVYLKNGFTLDHISNPNYFYFDSSLVANQAKRLHRFVFRKQELPAKFPATFDPNLTEFQNMDLTSYRRVWDCGNFVYKYAVVR